MNDTLASLYEELPSTKLFDERVLRSPYIPYKSSRKHMAASSTPRRCKLLGCGGTMTLARSNQAQQWHWVCTKCGHIEIMKG